MREINNLKQLRQARGISQAALASDLGVSQQAVAKWENGESSPQWAMAPALAAALNCSIDELFSDKEAG